MRLNLPVTPVEQRFPSGQRLISATDTTAALHDRLADLGGRMIVEALELAALRVALARQFTSRPTRLR